MKRVFIVSLMLVVCLAAAAQKKKELTTLVNVNYTLPKVAYEVEVILECERFVPGPYQNYAEKELGIRPEATQVSEKWAIKKINVLPQYIPDVPSQTSLPSLRRILPTVHSGGTRMSMSSFHHSFFPCRRRLIRILQAFPLPSGHSSPLRYFF